MKIKAQIDQLWKELENQIDAAYNSRETSDDDKHCIRDYARNQAWSDALGKLLDAETANERQHRGHDRQLPKGFSSETAARLILMRNFADGAQLEAMPLATTFLIYRKTAAEANLVGYLCRKAITAEWCERARVLDYAELMKRV